MATVYMRKTDEAPLLRRRVYEMYNGTGAQHRRVTRRINTEGIPTRKVSAPLERSTSGRCCAPRLSRCRCFGKTRVSSRTRVIARLLGEVCYAQHEAGTNAAEEWMNPCQLW